MITRAFVKYNDSSGNIVPMSLIVAQNFPPSDGIWVEVPVSQCCSSFDFLSPNNTNFKAWIKYSDIGVIVPGSLVIQTIRPGGNWIEIAYNYCCNQGTTTSTTTTGGSFNIKVGYSTTDPTTTVTSGVDNYIYTTSTANLNQSLNLLLNPPTNNWTIVRIQNGQYDNSHIPNTWYNTSFNYGNIPDQAFKAIITNSINGDQYIISRNGLVAFDNTVNTLISYTIA